MADLSADKMILLCGSSRLSKCDWTKWILEVIHNVSLWEKVFLGPLASHDIVITRFGHYVILASSSGAVPGGLVF